MDYLNTIKRGFAHTWNNKFMWVLGFLAALGSGSAFTNSNYSFNSSDMTFLENWLTPERAAALTAGVIGFACVGFILAIILWLVSLSARGGLIGAVAEMETKAGKPTFGSAFRMGWRHVGRLVGMTIVLYLVPFLLFLLIMAGFIAMAGGAAIMASGMEDPGAAMAGIGGLALVFLCLLCLLIPFVIVLSLIYPFAFRGIVLRNLGVMDSIRHGWATLKGNLGEIILLALAFFLINIIILILTLAILVPIGLAVGIPLSMLSSSNATFLTGLLAVLGILVAVIISALVYAIATAWQSSTFTVAYLEWTGRNVAVDTAKS